MSLQKCAEYGWLRAHKTDKKEISDLLRIIGRDFNDAVGNISADWRFGIAYNAALKLCTILLYLAGYRPETLSHHSSPTVGFGGKHEQDAKNLDTCRNKRNIA